MKPTTAPAPVIIQQALELGILCRPLHSPRIGIGCALEVSKECFWFRNGHDNELVPFSPTPEDICQDWGLTTLDLIRAEWQRASEEPW